MEWVLDGTHDKQERRQMQYNDLTNEINDKIIDLFNPTTAFFCRSLL